MEPSGEGLAFYDPPQAYAFAPPPPPPPRPEPNFGVSGFFRTYYLAPPLDGFLPHFGATIGGKNGAFMLGYLPTEGLVSLGFEYGRFHGLPLTQGAVALGFLAPSVDMQLFTNFSKDVHLAAGGSLLGLGMSSCSLVPGAVFFAQLRAPYVHAWFPLVVNEQGPDDSNARPFVGFGGALEAGLVFF